MSQEELENFRTQWKQEVSRPTNIITPTTVDNRLSADTKLAIKFYHQAVEFERDGRLNEALIYYRKAFRLDEDVDKTCFKLEKHSSVDEPETLINIQTPKHKSNKIPTASKNTAEESIKRLLSMCVIEEHSGCYFKPLKENKDCKLNKFPLEIIVNIFRHLILKDIQSFANFSLVNKKAFIISCNDEIWKNLAYHIYNTHTSNFMFYKKDILDFLSLNSNNYRCLMLYYPRIRWDGVYISTCRYTRTGNSETGFSQPIHLITYYRYLRMFPDGKVFALLTTQEPKNVVHKIDRDSKFKGLMVGTYKLQNKVDKTITTIYVEDRKSRIGTVFKYTLHLKQTAPGKHNKLSWINYSSFDYKCNNEIDYPLKNFTSYFFSKVKSYKIEYR